jgi:hypothetical protein
MGTHDLVCSHCKDCATVALGFPCCQCGKPAPRSAPASLHDRITALDMAAHATLRRERTNKLDGIIEASRTYARALERLEAAIREYVRTHGEPGQTVFFAFKWPEDAHIHIGPMRKVSDFAVEQDGRDLIRWLDERTGGECTILMLQMIVSKLGGFTRPTVEA